MAVEELGITPEALNNGFMPGNGASGPQYGYDDAGSLLTDPYKNIAIVYNHLNLPEQIGGIKILYDASGRKWQMEFPDGTVRQYIAGMEFVDDEFETVGLGGDGRIYLEEGSNGASAELIPEYYHKDHLGNVRVAFADRNGDGVVQLLDGSAGAAEVSQTLDYYPFGLQHPGAACRPDIDPENAYRYNGIERIEDLGLDLAFFRSYNPAIGRWMQVDPFADSYAPIAAYNGMGNNPILIVDPLGDQLAGYNEKSAERALEIIQSFFGNNAAAAKMGNLFSLASDGVTFNEIDTGDFLNALGRLSIEAMTLAVGYFQTVNNDEKNLVEVVTADEETSSELQRLVPGLKTGADVSELSGGGLYLSSSNFGKKGNSDGHYAIITLDSQREIQYNGGVMRRPENGETLAHELLGHGQGSYLDFSNQAGRAIQMGNAYLKANGFNHYRPDHGVGTVSDPNFNFRGLPPYYSPYDFTKNILMIR